MNVYATYLEGLTIGLLSVNNSDIAVNAFHCYVRDNKYFLCHTLYCHKVLKLLVVPSANAYAAAVEIPDTVM